MRLQPDALARLDDFRRGMRRLPTRPQAVRRLIENALALEEIAQIAADVQPCRPGNDPGVGVLIITTDRAVAALQELTCRAAGCRVVGIAHNTEDALRLASSAEFSILVSDTRIETWEDGLTVANRILAERPAVAIFVTDEPEVFLAGDRPEPAYLLANPRSPKMLRDVLRRAISGGFSAETFSKSP